MGCIGCLAIAALVAVPLVVIALAGGFLALSGEDKQRRQLDAVNLELLTEAERVRWAAYRQELAANHILAGRATQDIAEWLARSAPADP